MTTTTTRDLDDYAPYSIGATHSDPDGGLVVESYLASGGVCRYQTEPRSPVGPPRIPWDREMPDPLTICAILGVSFAVALLTGIGLVVVVEWLIKLF